MLIRAVRILAFTAFTAALAAAEVQRIAVFIGVDEGLRNETPLRYASRDAREMAEAFRGAGTFDEDRVYVLVNPSLEKIMTTLEEVKGRVKELRKTGMESLVLIYFSGHGGKEGLHIRHRKILILDACESGGFLRSKGGRVVEPPVAADGRIVDLKREYRANLYRAAIPLECEIYFPHRFWLSASAGQGFYFHNHGREARPKMRSGFEPGLSLGHQF